MKTEKKPKKKLSRRGYQIVKIIHILSAAIWISAGAIGLFLLTFILDKNNLLEILSTVHYIDLLIIIPANLLTFITGIIFSKYTEWGFFKHRWILLKYIFNVIPIVGGGLVFAPSIINMLSIAKKLGAEAMFDTSFILSKNIFTGAFIVIILMLITAVCLSVVKPKLRCKKSK